MTDEVSLTILERKEVLFYGDELTAVRAEDGHIYVGVRQMCLALGLDAQAQRRRMTRQTVLADGIKLVANLATSFGERDTYVLRVDMVPLWLAGIRTSAVQEEIRPKLERFQREAAKILWEAFQEGRLSADPTFDELLQADTPEVQAYKMIMAMAQMARQQILLKAELANHSELLEDLTGRLETIEASLGQANRYISAPQASRISQAVKAIALELGKRSGRNEFGGVYGEVYRRFEIAGYRELPAAKYDEAMRFLRDWYLSLTGNNMPF